MTKTLLVPGRSPALWCSFLPVGGFGLSLVLPLMLFTGTLQAQFCGDGENGIALRTQQEVNDFQTAFGPCDRVRSFLDISGDDISDLTPLGDLVEIRGNLLIWGSPALHSLQGLNNLQLVYQLIISQTRLEDLSGLDRLSQLWIGLWVTHNDELRTLDGMPALVSMCCFLEIESNPKLENLLGLSNVHMQLEAEVLISGNPRLRNLAGMPVMPSVRSLQVHGNSGLESLAGLNAVDGSLVERVSIQNNPALVNMSGMQWLQSALRITIFRNDALVNFAGMSGLTEVERFSVEQNATLTTLAGLEMLERVGDLPEGEPPDSPFTGEFWIRFNPALSSLQGLTGLKKSEGLWLYELPSLTSVSALNQLQDVGGLGLSFLPKLTSLDGLAALRSAEGVGIEQNVALTDCSALETLFDVIDDGAPGPGPGIDGRPDVADMINIDNNAHGCDSLNQIAPRPNVARVLTGSWFSPSSAGEGFMIHAVREHLTGPFKVQNGLAIGYFYGYDDQGGRFWLIGVHSGPMNWGEPITFNASSVSGGGFELFDPASIVESDWGTFTFAPSYCDAGVITLSGEFAGISGLHEKTLDVVRLGRVAGDYCSAQIPTDVTDSLTASWYDPLTSGQGFAFHKIDDRTGVVYFYGFDDSGAPLWLIGVWNEPVVIGKTLEIAMSQVSGGTFAEVSPENIIEEPWGVLRLHMEDCAAGQAELEGLDGKQVLMIEQLASSLGLECVN